MGGLRRTISSRVSHKVSTNIDGEGVMCCLGGMRSGNVGAPVFALHDAAVAALYSILRAFGSELIAVVKSSKVQMPFGTSADVVALLERCSTYNE